MFVPPVMLVRQGLGRGQQARGPQEPAAGSRESCAALGYRHLGLYELVEYLLRRMFLPSHISPFLRPNSNKVTGLAFGGQVTFHLYDSSPLMRLHNPP